jgi:hypothetical protein
MILFADDTNLLFQHENKALLSQIINNELENIANWFSANRLSLNIDKTKFISFGNNVLDHNSIILNINGINICQVNSISFLGVIIQNNLKWNEHIQNKASKVLKVNSILSRMKHTLPEKVLINIYNALILPHFTYGILAWGDTNRSLQKRLIVLQKKCLRHIANVKFNAHTETLFKKYHMLKLHDIYKVNCCKLYYRCKLNILPNYHTNKLPSIETVLTRSTRQSSNIYVNIIRLSIEKQLLNYKIGTQWNSLPNNIKEISNVSLTSFSRCLKSHVISSYNQLCTIRNCVSCM